jgi:hypothetical protein
MNLEKVFDILKKEFPSIQREGDYPVDNDFNAMPPGREGYAHKVVLSVQHKGKTLIAEFFVGQETMKSVTETTLAAHISEKINGGLRELIEKEEQT